MRSLRTRVEEPTPSSSPTRVADILYRGGFPTTDTPRILKLRRGFSGLVNVSVRGLAFVKGPVVVLSHVKRVNVVKNDMLCPFGRGKGRSVRLPPAP